MLATSPHRGFSWASNEEMGDYPNRGDDMTIFSYRDGYNFFKSQSVRRIQKTFALFCLFGKILLIPKLAIWAVLVLTMEVSVVCHEKDKDKREKLIYYVRFSFSSLSLVIVINTVHMSMLFQWI
ncbi:hypothetical protein V6N13_111958 [Hibiscus sabdariffa]